MYLARATFALMFALGASTIMVQAQDEPKPDNTKVNQRDRSANQPTADQQKNNVSDRDLTKQIRRKIVEDKSLSTYGHNVKVISQNGMVTLRGPVHSEEEKRAIENHAAEVAGRDRVKNEIEVKGDADRSK
jgi:osmotically-inducible protein OsmY